MGKAGKLALALGIVVIIAAVTWWVVSMNNQSQDTSTTDQPTPSNQSTSEETPSDQSSSDAKATVVITYNGSSYEPAAATVKSGDTIKIVNSSLEVMEFASDPHPTHTINPELNTGDIEPGGEKTITLTKTGTWGYHNHYNASQRGSITVE
ncbi:MAG TPA: cupredoxin domain-containing protein [Candidatus Saccharimonadales bacterium]|nr:cupredoxin domain-containing protein [Candidatus Saccharimonadales bacterium]